MVDISHEDTLNFENITISSLSIKNEFLIKGSESFIYDGNFLGKKSLIKTRKPKTYRNADLDLELRLQRLRIESKMIKSALNNGILVPTLYNIDLQSFSMQLEKIEGNNLGFLLQDPAFQSNQILKDQLFHFFGEIVGYLHNIEIIHGDLTPLNIIVNKENIYVIDFGLAFFSNEIKDKAMDLFILFGALKIYPQENNELFSSFLQGYKVSNDYNSVIDSFDKLTRKGRYKS